MICRVGRRWPDFRWVVVLYVLGCTTILAPSAQAFTEGFPLQLMCSNSTISEETIAKYMALPAPSNGASVQGGTPVTFSGESKFPLTFSVASSPGLLSSPDIDSGLGSPQPGTELQTFTSTSATATARTIYWAASFTVTPEGCEHPATFATPAHTLTVVPRPSPEAGPSVKQAQPEAVPGAAFQVEKVKVTATGLRVTLNASHAGTVTITGPGLRKTARRIAPGVDRVTVPFTKEGKAERRRRKKIDIAVSLITSGRTSSSSTKIKL